jgi:hypothetical protein
MEVQKMKINQYDIYIRCDSYVNLYGASNAKGLIRGIMIGLGNDVILTQLQYNANDRIDMYVPVCCTEDVVKQFIEIAKKYFSQNIKCIKVN